MSACGPGHRQLQQGRGRVKGRRGEGRNRKAALRRAGLGWALREHFSTSYSKQAGNHRFHRFHPPRPSCTLIGCTHPRHRFPSSDWSARSVQAPCWPAWPAFGQSTLNLAQWNLCSPPSCQLPPPGEQLASQLSAVRNAAIWNLFLVTKIFIISPLCPGGSGSGNISFNEMDGFRTEEEKPFRRLKDAVILTHKLWWKLKTFSSLLSLTVSLKSPAIRLSISNCYPKYRSFYSSRFLHMIFFVSFEIL